MDKNKVAKATVAFRHPILVCFMLTVTVCFIHYGVLFRELFSNQLTPINSNSTRSHVEHWFYSDDDGTNNLSANFKVSNNSTSSPLMLLSQPGLAVTHDNIYKHVAVRNQTFTIFSLRSRLGVDIGEKFRSCPFSNCKILTDPSHLAAADAVLVHLRNVSKDIFPVNRRPQQLWIGDLREPPLLYYVAQLTPYNGLFNVSSTYLRSAADVLNSYGYTAPLSSTEERSVDPVSKIDVQRPKLAAWFVTHCRTLGRREDYVARLTRYIAVDIYGRCGSMSCAKTNQSYCYAMLERTYKFYLAFENSACVDYVTEKAWNILRLNVVPVVLGGADYKALLPPHSYIDIRDFSSARQLAEYLTMLSMNDHLYRKYFEWKRHFRVGITNYACQLCAFMNRNYGRRTNMVVKRLVDIYNPSLHCIDFKDYYKGRESWVARGSPLNLFGLMWM